MPTELVRSTILSRPQEHELQRSKDDGDDSRHRRRRPRRDGDWGQCRRWSFPSGLATQSGRRQQRSAWIAGFCHRPWWRRFSGLFNPVILLRCFIKVNTTLVDFLFIELVTSLTCEANVLSTKAANTRIDTVYKYRKRKRRFLMEILEWNVLGGAEFQTCGFAAIPLPDEDLPWLMKAAFF